VAKKQRNFESSNFVKAASPCVWW